MKLSHVSGSHGPRLVVAYEGREYAVADILPGAPALIDDLIGDPYALERLRVALDRNAASADPIDLPPSPRLPPLARPRAVIAIGLNYHDHCRETAMLPPAEPMVFAKLAGAITGHGHEIRWSSSLATEVDWEGELGVVIGRTAVGITPAEALDAVFGYTIINDITARDLQRRDTQWVRAKSLTGFCPMGPVLVTADEVPDPQALPIATRVNGVIMQDSTTAEMVFGVRELIAFLSHSFALQPGDVIATGTPAGVGGFRSPPIHLADGDEVEVEIGSIGVLANGCVVTAGPVQPDPG